MDNLHIFLGATVADAATRPLHWVYDSKKLKTKSEICLRLCLYKLSCRLVPAADTLADLIVPVGLHERFLVHYRQLCEGLELGII